MAKTKAKAAPKAAKKTTKKETTAKVSEKQVFEAKKQHALEVISTLQNVYANALNKHVGTGNSALDSIQKLEITQVALKIGEVYNLVNTLEYRTPKNEEAAK